MISPRILVAFIDSMTDLPDDMKLRAVRIWAEALDAKTCSGFNADNAWGPCRECGQRLEQHESIAS